MARRSHRYRQYGWGGFAPYVSVEDRRREAEERAASLAKKGQKLAPVRIEGRVIAQSFWGKAWCENLESYSDYENRLPRGRSYARNGSVIDLQIEAGKVRALVSGSSVYTIEIAITPVASAAWAKISGECTGKVSSVIELLQGRLSGAVMEVMTRKGGGLFPTPREIRMKCSCPDYATMCKHVAATLYGVGTRLDEQPDLLFTLRKVNPVELIGEASTASALLKTPAATAGRVLEDADLSGIFGIDLDLGAPSAPEASARAGRAEPKARRPKTAARGRKVQPATVTAKALVSRGLSHPTIQNWLRAGVLGRTEARGVYRTTPETESRIAAYLARKSSREQ